MTPPGREQEKEEMSKYVESVGALSEEILYL